MQKESGIDKKFKIIILTSPSPFRAAGTVAADLQSHLKENGHKVQIIVNDKIDRKCSDITSIYTELGFFLTRITIKIRQLFKHSIKTDHDYYMYGVNLTSSPKKVSKTVRSFLFKPDIIIYLFPQNFLSLVDLKVLYDKINVPILWFMMDMAPLTGGCHYSWDCQGYIKECGNCPGILSDTSKDLTYRNWHKKSEIIEKIDIVPIAASQWQFRQLRKSSLFRNKRQYKVLLPINDTIFRPSDKTQARKGLDLPLNKKIIFSGAVDTREKRKGFKELKEALKTFISQVDNNERSNIHLAIAGKHNPDLELEIECTTTFLGYLSYQQLALAFNASDVFVCPSIEDSGPMMVNQAIMCGVPVVAFEMGVAIDLVHTGKTGYRARLGDSKDMAKGIRFILELNEEEYNKMNDNVLNMAYLRCNPKQQVKKLERIFLFN